MQEILETLSKTGDDYATAQMKLDEYFSPKNNVDYESSNSEKLFNRKGKQWTSTPLD